MDAGIGVDGGERLRRRRWSKTAFEYPFTFSGVRHFQTNVLFIPTLHYLVLLVVMYEYIGFLIYLQRNWQTLRRDLIN
jgi:hypothetical protein